MSPRPWQTQTTKTPPLSPPVVASAVAVAVLSGLAVQSGPPERRTGDGSLVADSYDGFDVTAAEKLRQDQCLMTGALRTGGHAMFATAQDALNQSPDKLEAAAGRDHGTTPRFRRRSTRTPLSRARSCRHWRARLDARTKPLAVLDANEDATKVPAAGAKALGELLGHSWTADHLARWQDYWAPGGIGWIGDAPAVIEVHAAEGKCVDVEGGKKDSGTPVQHGRVEQ